MGRRNYTQGYWDDDPNARGPIDRTRRIDRSRWRHGDDPLEPTPPRPSRGGFDDPQDELPDEPYADDRT